MSIGIVYDFDVIGETEEFLDINSNNLNLGKIFILSREMTNYNYTVGYANTIQAEDEHKERYYIKKQSDNQNI